MNEAMPIRLGHSHFRDARQIRAPFDNYDEARLSVADGFARDCKAIPDTQAFVPSEQFLRELWGYREAVAS
ncbi:hypothetical protein HZY97_11800 [Sphingomonas sp. R-74633]|uniref:hypothetical protein n=1 Tax=Sphingomonas sp. R-74633 TaxID=2751188 RepID=UPI0015D1227C|nr:hypothetical protein [Sphingomonas sp. R-74633]NYT41445.1 hypothetical protein [Sphingomonas sp. R-74633]